MGLDHKVLSNLLISILEFYKAEPTFNNVFRFLEKHNMHKIKIIQLEKFSKFQHKSWKKTEFN